MARLNPTLFRPLSGDYRVDENGCWIWQKGVDQHGYGQTRRGGGTSRAHRKYYAHFVGPIPEGAAIHHKCHVPACVNPDHLEPLSRVDHGREHRWTEFGISEEKVERIRELAKDRDTRYVDIMAELDVSMNLVKRVLRGCSPAFAGQQPERPEAYCLFCGDRITTGHRHKKFCNREHREKYNKRKQTARRRAAKAAA